MPNQSLTEKGRNATAQVLREYAEKLIAQKAVGLQKIDLSKLKKYAVISTPRVGSSLFCQSLEESGRLGWPVEWFNDLYIDQVNAVSSTSHLEMQEYIDGLYYGTVNKDNHIFGVNFHVNQYIEWKKRGFDILSLGFDKIYYLERRNKFKQAYSYVKAMKTKLWSAETEQLAGYENGVQIIITEQELVAGLKEILDWVKIYKSQLQHYVAREFLFEDFVVDGATKAALEICDELEVLPPKIPKPIETANKQSLCYDEKQLNTILGNLGVEIYR